MVESNLNSSEFADKNPVEKANLSMNEPDFVNRISEIEPVYPIAESTANIIATDDLLSKPIVEDVKVEDPRKRGLFTSLTEAVKPDPVVIPQWLRDDEKPREVKASTSPESRGKDKPFGERLGELIDQAGDNLRNMFVVDRREFMKIMGALGLAWKAGELISSTKTQAQETAAQPEVFRMPYEVRVEEEGGLTSFGDLMIDDLRVNAEELLGGRILKHANGVYDMELDTNFKFLDDLSARKLIEISGLSFQDLQFNTEEQLIEVIQDIFEDLRHGVALQYSNDAQMYSFSTFKNGIARNLEEYPELPLWGEGNTLVGLLLSTKILSDLSAANPDSELITQLNDGLNTALIRNTLVNLVKNEANDLEPNHIDVNYVTENNSFQLPTEYNPGDSRFIPEQHRGFIDTYNERMNPTNLPAVSTSMADSMVGFLVPRYSSAYVPVNTMEDMFTVLADKTSYPVLSRSMSSILTTFQSQNGLEDTPEGFAEFINTLEQHSSSFPDLTNLELDLQHELEQMNPDTQKAFMFLRTLQHATGNVVNTAFLSSTNHTRDEYAQVIAQFYNNPTQNIPPMVLPMVELLGLNTLGLRSAENNFTNFYASTEEFRTAQFYAMRSLWFAVNRYVDEGFRFDETLPEYYSADTKRILSFYETYKDNTFIGYDNTAEKVVQDNLEKLSEAVNGVNQEFNYQETRILNFRTPSSLPGIGGITHRSKKEVNVMLDLKTKIYSARSFEHENKHLNDVESHLHLVNEYERGRKPRESLYEWILFNQIAHSFRKNHSELQLSVSLDEGAPWQGFSTTFENIESVRSLFEHINMSLPPEGAKQEMLEALFNFGDRIKENRMFGVNAELTNSINSLNIEDQKKLNGFVAKYFAEYYEQNLRHEFMGDNAQLVSHLSNPSDELLESFDPIWKLRMAVQIADEYGLMRGQSFSDLDPEVKRTLFRKQDQDSAFDTDDYIKYLLELHYAQNDAPFGPEKLYYPQIVNLAFKLSLYNLQFDEAGNLVNDALSYQFIYGLNMDMQELFSTDRLSEREKLSFVSDLITNLRRMGDNDRVDSTMRALAYTGAHYNVSGIGSLWQKLDEVRNAAG
jgi:hypothetical protein